MLKLRAQDAADLIVLSATLQDAIVPVSDLAYLPDEQRFVMVANRFRWEAGETQEPPFERVHCAITIEGVSAVQRRGIALCERGRLLNLLSLSAENGALLLTFSADAAIRLESARWMVHLADMGEPWPTAQVPQHPLDDAATDTAP